MGKYFWTALFRDSDVDCPRTVPQIVKGILLKNRLRIGKVIDIGGGDTRKSWIFQGVLSENYKKNLKSILLLDLDAEQWGTYLEIV